MDVGRYRQARARAHVRRDLPTVATAGKGRLEFVESMIRLVDAEVAALCRDRHDAHPHASRAHRGRLLAGRDHVADISLSFSPFRSKWRLNTYVPAWPKRTHGAAYILKPQLRAILQKR
jgi:hypothetical protein